MTWGFPIWGFSQIRGTFFWGPYNKGYSIWGSILEYPNFGKLPYLVPELHVGPASSFTSAQRVSAYRSSKVRYIMVMGVPLKRA